MMFFDSSDDECSSENVVLRGNIWEARVYDSIGGEQTIFYGQAVVRK